MTPMKDVNKGYARITAENIDDERFRDEELWESGHVLYARQRTHSILNSKYQKSVLCQITSDRKHLISDKQIILYHVLTRYEFFFNGTLGT